MYRACLGELHGVFSGSFGNLLEGGNTVLSIFVIHSAFVVCIWFLACSHGRWNLLRRLMEIRAGYSGLVFNLKALDSLEQCEGFRARGVAW